MISNALAGGNRFLGLLNADKVLTGSGRRGGRQEGRCAIAAIWGRRQADLHDIARCREVTIGRYPDIDLAEAHSIATFGHRRVGLRPQTSGALQLMPIDLAHKVEGAGTTVAEVPTSATMPTSLDASIHIEVSRGELGVKLRWPASQAGACATLLRELLAPPR